MTTALRGDHRRPWPGTPAGTRAAVVVAAVLPLLLLTSAPGATARAAEPTPGTSVESPAPSGPAPSVRTSVALVSVDPPVARVDDEVVLRATVDVGTRAVRDGALRVRLARTGRITSSAALDDVDDDDETVRRLPAVDVREATPPPPEPPAGDPGPDREPGPDEDPDTPLAAGDPADEPADDEPEPLVPGPVDVELRVPVADLRPGAPAVLPLVLQVLDDDGDVVAEDRTLLPWLGAAEPEGVRVATVAALTAPPVLGPDGALLVEPGPGDPADPASAPADGRGVGLPQPAAARLAGVVAATGDLPGVAWAVDADLLASLQALAAAGDGAAGGLLAEITARAVDRQVLPLPLADADVAALVRGEAEPLAADALLRGRDAVLERLPGARAADVVWPADGLADRVTLDALSAAGARGFVLAPAAVPAVDASGRGGPAEPPPDSPAAVATSLGGRPVAVVDADLSTLVAGRDGRRAEDAARLRAELALLALDEPDVRRDVLLGLDRDAQVDLELLDGLGDLWGAVPGGVAEPVGLDALLAAAPAVRRAVDRPASRLLLDADRVDLAAGAARAVDGVAALAVEPAAEPFEAARVATLRVASAAWRDDDQQPLAARQAELLSDEVARLVGAVRVSTSPLVTLTGTTGDLPATVVNDLPVAVQVSVRVDTPSPRLDATASEDIVVEAERSRTLRVPVEVRGAGRFTAGVGLVGPDGRQVGEDVPVVLEVRAVTGVALAVTAVAGVVLVSALALQALRRRRRAGGTGPGPGVQV